MIDRKGRFYDQPRETMPPEEREAYRDRILRAAIRHAYEKAPATRRKLDSAGVRPEDVHAAADLVGVPLTRKSDLKRIQQEELPFGGLAAVPPRAMRRIYVSPGPTYDPEGREGAHWGWEKAFVAAGFLEGDIVQNTFQYHFSPAGLMFDEALIRIGCTVVPAGVGNTELQARVMRDLAVTGYVGTPSFLATILETAGGLGIAPGNGLRLQVGLVAAELLPESLRGRFENEFGVQVRQAYGTADAGLIAYECGEGHGMHLSDEILVELLDPADGTTAGPGEVGEVVVTLFDATYPLVRFATGDLSLYTDDPCPCGRTAPRLVRILGRVDQVTKVKGIFIHPEQVIELERKVPEVRALRLVVTRSGNQDRMTIQAALRGDVPASEALLSRIASAAREITRLRGEVVLVEEGTFGDEETKIVDERKWE